MNHLKTYKLFESIDIDELKDILLEFEDAGLTYNISNNNSDTIISLKNSNKKVFDISNIKEILLNIENYLNYLNRKFQITLISGNSYNIVEMNDEFISLSYRDFNNNQQNSKLNWDKIISILTIVIRIK